MNTPTSRAKNTSSAPHKENIMEFHTFYDYFLFTKSWAYVMMFIVLPAYVLYWNFVLFPERKKRNNSPK